MVKVPIEIKKKLEVIGNSLHQMLAQIGELEMNKSQLMQRAADLSQQRAQFWAQVCQEYKIDPLANYSIDDDGTVKTVASISIPE